MRTDLELLQGLWSITSLAMDGQEMDASMFANASIVVNANRFTSIGMGAEYEGTLEIDPTTSPRQLNMQFDVGPEKGNVNLCIYEVDGEVPLSGVPACASLGHVRARLNRLHRIFQRNFWAGDRHS
jgi:uncharacterized protein (TIGR03067 family)